jgi:hypothetical protein
MDEIKALLDGNSMKELAKHLNVDVKTLYRWDKIPNKYHDLIRDYMDRQVDRIEQFTENF